jgi:superfamily II DNA or RNA helicase
VQTKILIKDEVNVTLQGLDLTTRKNLVKKFSFELPYARHLPAVRLGRWDGKVSFFTLGGSSYINLLPDILAYLDQQGYEFELIDQRDYRREFAFEKVAEDSYSHKTWPAGHSDAGQPIKLRDYQVDVINNFFANPQCLQEVATGAGKTLITSVLSHRCEPYGRTIVIVPNKSLVTQTEADYKNLGLDVGVYFGDRKEFNKTHTICTWQSLNNMFKNTKNGVAEVTIQDFLAGVVCIMVDEVHMAKAEVLKTMLTGVMGMIPIRWGLTGTIPKEPFEFFALRVSLGEVVGKLSASELQDQGVLANCEVNIIQLQDHGEYKEYQKELQYLTTNEDRIKYIASVIAEIAETGNTLVLIDRIQAGKMLEQYIPNSVFISGVTKDVDRKEQYDEVAVNDNKTIIATYGIAAVGINVPRLFNVVLIEPGKSFVRVIQSIGRGLRKSGDKDFVNIWDIASTCKFAKRHLTKRKQFYKEANYNFNIKKAAWC